MGGSPVSTPSIVVLGGGTSSERDISLRSARNVLAGLNRHAAVRLEILDTNELPSALDPDCDVILPMLHGGYGEDGSLQHELEREGFAYAGSDAESCALCIDKSVTKRLVREVGVAVAPEVVLEAPSTLDAADIRRELGPEIILKPLREGSSIGLQLLAPGDDLSAILASLPASGWMAETRIHGREFTVGILGEDALEIIEIHAPRRLFDFNAKYQPGLAKEILASDLGPAARARMIEAARAAFNVCGCRDFARIDFILPEGEHEPVLLEINTHPGMTPASLLPRCAAESGITFPELCLALVEPAIDRFSSRKGVLR